jgi:hypothetical protein
MDNKKKSNKNEMKVYIAYDSDGEAWIYGGRPKKDKLGNFTTSVSSSVFRVKSMDDIKLAGKCNKIICKFITK